MRLTCPNCKAQYEVDERVIPEGGRDVQCSSCGSTWFQYPAEVALRMRAADLDDDDDDEDDGVPGAERAASTARPPAAAGGERQIDRTVLDVLRQEAERELTERRKAAPSVETQTEMGLVSRPRPRSATAEGKPVTPRQVPQPAAEATPQDAVPRRNLLPDIEELTSTLEPSRHTRKRDDTSDTAETPVDASRGRDFRRGLTAVILVGTILAALYALAPMLAQSVPALSGPLSGYVVMIDSLRAAVAGMFGG